MHALDLTTHWSGYAAIIVFVLAYLLVVTEEFTALRYSSPGNMPPPETPMRPRRL